MKIVKPAWVNHGGKAIFSIDIHPDGTRFATGGQGEDSGKIVIWSMLPIQDAKKESDKAVPKLLCQMDNHLACVDCVRWSNNGKLLASGGDDKLVMIWRYAGGTSRSFGSEHDNVETWRCSTTLRGHAGDVLDVAWAPGDVYLATCSVDNMVIIWNAQNFPEQVRVLKGHSGLVKGVVWDPTGKFLASQSDDKSLIVWRTRDWRAETTITEPFVECGGTTHVLRPAWSPEGSLLVSAHAMNNSGPVAKIVERTANWKADMDFVGHRKAVSCVRFNPRVFVKKVSKGSSEKPVHYCCCAIGSRDTSFSVWLTCLKRPLVVLHDMFENSILDLAWNAAGTELLVCSTDGTVGYVQFTPDELTGRALTDEEKGKLLVKLYGQSAISNGLPAALSGSSAGSSRIIESADMLHLQQNAAAAAQTTVAAAGQTPVAAAVVRAASHGVADPAAVDTGPAAQSTCSLSRSDSTSAQVRLATKQLETRTPDGKRRITPIFLSPPPDLGDVPLPVALPTFTTSTEQSKIVVETTEGRGLAGAGAAVDVAAAADNTDEPPQLEAAPLSPAVGSSIVSIQPMTPGEAKLAGSRRRAPNLASTPSAVTDDKTTEKEAAKERSSVAKGSSDSAAAAAAKTKRRLYSAHDRDKQRRKNKQLPDDTDSPPVVSATALQQQRTEQTGAAPAATSGRFVGTGETLPTADILPLPAPQKSITASVESGITSFTVEAQNDVRQTGRSSSGTNSLHCLRCRSHGKQWEHVLRGRITLLAASRWGVVAASADQMVTLLSPEGKLIVPPLAVDGTVATVQAVGQFCLVATCKGSVSVWNMKALECTVDRASLVCFSSSTGALVDNVQLTDHGAAVATLQDGSAFCYDSRMRAWARLFTGKSDFVRLCATQQTTAVLGSSGKAFQQAAAQGPLTLLSGSTTAGVGGSMQPGNDAAAAANALYQMSLGPSSEAMANTQRLCTVTFLEEQLIAAEVLGSSAEYKQSLLSLVRYLTKHALEGRLRVICNELLGTMYKQAGASTTTERDNARKILGINKRELLGEILTVIGSNLQLQRLFAEYQQLLTMASTASASLPMHNVS